MVHLTFKLVLTSCAEFCAEITDDMVNIQISNSPAQESDDDDDVNSETAQEPEQFAAPSTNLEIHVPTGQHWQR